MGFLSPWFLGGLTAIGLPIWLHLLRRLRGEPHPFSSLMFFERRPQSKIRQRRLRYLLLFALRVAILALLALAFANPFIRTTAPASKKTSVLIVAVDRSFSMRAGSMRAQNRLEQAKREAAQLLSGLTAGRKAQVMALDSGVQYLTQMESDKTELTAAVNSIRNGDGKSSFGEFARALRALAQSTKASLEVHLFSDMQQTSQPPSYADLDPGPQATIHLHPIQSEVQPNLAVESVEAPARVWDGSAVKVVATVAAWNTKDVAHRSVALFVDGKQVESKQTDVPANGRARLEFHFEPGHGRHRCELRMEPHDVLPGDDTLKFSVERSDPEQVLYLGRSNQNRAALYYRTAMEASASSPFRVTPSTGAADFSKYAFVVLSDPGPLSRDLASDLETYVKKGGGLLILAGPETALRGTVPVTGASIQAGRTEPVERTISQMDTQHPVLRHTNGLNGISFSRLERIDPKGATVLARTGEDIPVLLEQAVGGGRALTFANSLDGTTSNFPLQAVFVPFIQDSALYLAGEDTAQSNLAAGAPVELRRSAEQRGAASVTDPDGKAMVPFDQATTIQAQRLDREGFYDVKRADGREQLLAVNADRRESDLAPMQADLIALWQKSGNASAENAQSTASGELSTQIHSFWRFALLLVLLIAIVESVVASRYLSASKEIA